MKEPIDKDKVDAFVSSLWNAEHSLAHRVYAAYFIRTYSDEIKNYIDTRYSQSGANLDTVTWAKKTRQLLARYKKGPNGYAYNPTNGSLESLYAEPFTGHSKHSHHSHLIHPARSFALRLTLWQASASSSFSPSDTLRCKPLTNSETPGLND